jgi:hypothetical protein
MKLLLSFKLILLATFFCGLWGCEDDNVEPLTVEEIYEVNPSLLEELKPFTVQAGHYEFATSEAKIRYHDGRYLLVAEAEGRKIDIWFSNLGKGQLNAQTDNNLEIVYHDNDAQVYSSKHYNGSNDAILTINGIDSTAQTFSGTFSGTAYCHKCIIYVEMTSGRFTNIPFVN